METKSLSEVMNEYNRLSDKSKIIVLNNALDLMEQYNGRTRGHCKALGMGYQTTDGQTFFKAKQP